MNRLPEQVLKINLLDKIINNDLKNENLMYDVHNKLKFSNQSNNFKLPTPVTTISVCKGKNLRGIHVSGLTCLWDSGASDSMIKKSYVRKLQEKFRKNKQEYDTAAGIYTSNYDVKVDFMLTEFSTSKLITHRFHVGDEQKGADIG